MVEGEERFLISDSMKRKSLLFRRNIAPDYFLEWRIGKQKNYRKEDIDE